MTPIELAEMLGSGELSLDSKPAMVELKVDELRSLAADESINVRAGVAMLLSRAEPISGLKQPFSVLLDDTEPRVIAETLWALDEKPELARSCSALVIKCLDDPDWKIRLPAITVLGSVARDRLEVESLDWATILERLVCDDCEAVRSEAAKVLGCCRISQGCFETLLKELYDGDSSDVRRSALKAARMCTPTFDRVAWIIEAGLRDESYDVRIEACLLASCYPSARTQFATALQKLVASSDNELSLAAATALAEN